jgi:hypothetical protein
MLSDIHPLERIQYPLSLCKMLSNLPIIRQLNHSTTEKEWTIVTKSHKAGVRFLDFHQNSFTMPDKPFR